MIHADGRCVSDPSGLLSLSCAGAHVVIYARVNPKSRAESKAAAAGFIRVPTPCWPSLKDAR